MSQFAMRKFVCIADLFWGFPQDRTWLHLEFLRGLRVFFLAILCENLMSSMLSAIRRDQYRLLPV